MVSSSSRTPAKHAPIIRARSAYRRHTLPKDLQEEFLQGRELGARTRSLQFHVQASSDLTPAAHDPAGAGTKGGGPRCGQREGASLSDSLNAICSKPESRLDLCLVPHDHRFPRSPCAAVRSLTGPPQSLNLVQTSDQLLSDFLNAIHHHRAAASDSGAPVAAPGGGQRMPSPAILQMDARTIRRVFLTQSTCWRRAASESPEGRGGRPYPLCPHVTEGSRITISAAADDPTSDRVSVIVNAAPPIAGETNNAFGYAPADHAGDHFTGPVVCGPHQPIGGPLENMAKHSEDLAAATWDKNGGRAQSPRMPS